MSAIGTIYAKAVCRGEKHYPDDIPELFREEVYEYCKKHCEGKL